MGGIFILVTNYWSTKIKGSILGKENEFKKRGTDSGRPSQDVLYDVIARICLSLF